MASKRQIKKNINTLTIELATECYTYKFFHPSKDHSKTDTALENIVTLRNVLINRVNNSLEPKNYKKNRTHFRAIAKDLSGMVSLMDSIA